MGIEEIIRSLFKFVTREEMESRIATIDKTNTGLYCGLQGRCGQNTVDIRRMQTEINDLRDIVGALVNRAERTEPIKQRKVIGETKGHQNKSRRDR